MTSTLSHEHRALRKLWWVGLLAIVSAVLANLIVRAIAVASFGVSGTFQYFQPATIIISTTIYLLLALESKYVVLGVRITHARLRPGCMEA